MGVVVGMEALSEVGDECCGSSFFVVWFFLVLGDFDDAGAGAAGEVAVVPAGCLADPAAAVVALGEVGLEDVSFAEVAFVVVEAFHAV